MTAAQRDKMLDHMDDVRERKEKREKTLEKLAEGARFPDDDLQDRLRAIIREGRRRQQIDIDTLCRLEDEFELLGGNDPDGEWEED